MEVNSAVQGSSLCGVQGGIEAGQQEKIYHQPDQPVRQKV